MQVHKSTGVGAKTRAAIDVIIFMVNQQDYGDGSPHRF